MDVTGFSDPDNVAITTLAEYSGKIYAGVTNDVNGAQIWSSFNGDNNSWTQVGPESPGSAPASVTALTVFSDTLYAAIEPVSDAPLQIWRSYGGSVWTTMISDGFGNSDNTRSGGMVVYGDYLYLGGGNAASGAQLWRSSDGENWTAAITPAFGDSNNQTVESVFVFQNQLHASVKNAVTGIEIWRWTDGTRWEQTNPDGFGDSNNTGTNSSNATADFLGHLYLGMSNNVAGGELWRKQHPYDVDLSQDEAKSGTAGQNIIYTVQITNTGTMTDTFDLSATGNNWTTAVSTSTITLNPGAGDLFSVTVSIPSGALGNDTEQVTITATSQGNAARRDSTQLTTTVLPVYGVNLSPDDTLGGLPGKTITYTLTINNSGNVTDTFYLAFTGNAWATVLSSPSIVLAPSASGVFTVTVDIPADALGGDADSTTITATSRGDVAKSDSALLATSVDTGFGVDLSADSSISGQEDAPVTYRLHITNTGNVIDTFDLVAEGHSWPSTLSTFSMTLAAAASAVFSVTVDIQVDAQGGDVDSTSITATSRGDGTKSDGVLLATSVDSDFGVELSADSSLSGQAVDAVTYTLHITNTGTVSDTFDLEATGHSWPSTLSTFSMTLDAAASAIFTVTINIPTGALGGDADSTTITATSRGDGAKSATTILSTNVIAVYSIDLSGVDSLIGYPGRTVTYTMWITNLGNSPDMVDIEASGNGWQTVLSTPSLTLAVGERSQFTISVSTPSDATDLENDKVTITASSKQDAKIGDTASLTTINRSLPEKIFLPVINLG